VNKVSAALKVNGFEFELIKVLRSIVAETMAYPPVKPQDSESFLPADLVDQAQAALRLYGLDIDRNDAMDAAGGAA
jgi:hypothetical protein